MTAASETKRRLIKTAMNLFHTRGYHATGIAEILERASVKSGSLYYFFQSKEGLLTAVLEAYKAALEPAILKPLREGAVDPIDRVFGLLALYRENLLRTRFRYGCPIGNLAIEVADAIPEARTRIAENFEQWRLAVRAFLNDAGERLPPDLDRDKLATFVLTTMEGAVMQARAYQSVEPFDASVQMLRDYFDRLVQSTSTPGGSS